MKLLIAGSSDRLFALQEFASAVSKFEVEIKVVNDREIYSAFPGSRTLYQTVTPSKFNQLITEFKPDVVFLDAPSPLGVLASNARIPVLVHLRGHYWLELQWAREMHPEIQKKIALWWTDKNIEKCFRMSNGILPICEYLANEARIKFPSKKITVLYHGIDPSKWFSEVGMQLKHPCVGLLQNANIYGKVKEIFNFKRVVEAMPDVTFYWAGDGRYREMILKELNYSNFVWLGRLQYPDDVRKYLSELDLYAHPSGMDMSPSALLEAQAMQKAVVATKVGGIPEIMVHGSTGYLIEQGDANSWLNRLQTLLEDRELAKNMGIVGREFVSSNFNWDSIARKFMLSLNSLITD